LRYRFERLVTQFTIDQLTGEVYPVDGMFNYGMSLLSVVVEDNEGNEGALNAKTVVTVSLFIGKMYLSAKYLFRAVWVYFEQYQIHSVAFYLNGI
jgi:hypothetical protein